jgi:hypothetical protein
MLAPLYQRLVDRMKPSLMAALDLEADAGLSELHVALSEALIAGHRVSAGRLARAVARHELAALDGALG